MTNFIQNTDRQSLQSFASIEQLNEAVSIHMQTLKENSCKEKIMKLLSVMSQHSLQILGVSFLGVETMAEMLGVSTRTIQRYTKELENLKIIQIVKTADRKRKGQTSNTYVILPVEAKDNSIEETDQCHPISRTSCQPNQSLNLSSEQPKDHKERKDEPQSHQAELVLPTYVPERFAKIAALISSNEQEIVKLWSKVSLAYSKANLDHQTEYYLPQIISVLKGIAYKVKFGKVRNIAGYFFKGMEKTFDRLFLQELGELVEAGDSPC
ncbi:MAG: helix-turn-helix domain-containing protein [Bacillaceae bacterium]|nr:helix-turn-helix domain-containing protein [Bacillaceae bacterium]